jgi:carbon monoxide dehydrogenase subunit G
MISITDTVTTSRSRADVFDYVADFTTVAEWDPGIVASERISGDGGVGTRYAVTATFFGREVSMTYEVLEYDPASRIVLRGTSSNAEAIDTITFHDRGEGTEVAYAAEFRLQGFMRLAEPFLGGTFRRLGHKAITGLDRALNG